MKDERTLSFKNRSFIQIEVIFILFLIFTIVQAIFFENKYLNSSIGMWLVVIIIVMQHPYRYVIVGDKLVLKFRLLRNKIINIRDIQEIDVSKHNCLSFTYKPAGFDNVSHYRLLVNDMSIKIVQEELTKRNSNIEVLFN